MPSQHQPVRAHPQSAGHAALAIVVALVVGLGLALVFGLDDDGGGVVAVGQVTTTTTTALSPTTTIGGSTSLAATTVPEPTTVPKTPGVPRLYIAGDSTAGGLAAALKPLVEPTGVEVRVDYKNSSGLTRPDFYDWPSRLRAQMAALSPDMVIVQFGGNDAQPITLADGRKVNVDKPEWTAEYGRRVGDAMDVLSADGRKVVWVGVPSARSAAFNGRLVVLRNALLAQAAVHPSVTFVDPWPMFQGVLGTYSDFAIDADGQARDMRAQDGFHLNPTGARRLGRYVADVVAALRQGSPVPPPTTATPFYKVQAGEGWAQIAGRLNVPVEALWGANDARADTLLVAGQQLALPTAG
ncbi:MAG TPA: DUF459 domain-containing protein [Acidimicrobiales bacterium]